MVNGLLTIAAQPIFPTTLALPLISSPWYSVTWVMTQDGCGVHPNPSTGDRKMMGEYLLNAQGEDVVAGIRNADPIENLKTKMPEAYNQFMDITAKLEKHYKDMQDVEFTIEHRKLWMLQTRTGKRTAKSAVKIAVDMANDGLITREEAVKRVTPDQVDTMLHPQFNEEAKKNAEKSGSLFLARV